MRRKTIVFLQELYHNAFSQDIILSFCKNSVLQEMEDKAFFLNQILIGDKAKEIVVRYDVLKKRITKISEPGQAITVMQEFDDLSKQYDKYMLATMQAVKRNVFFPEEIQLLHPVFEKYAVEKIHKMISKVLFILICQQGPDIRKALMRQLFTLNNNRNKIENTVQFFEEIVALIQCDEIYAWRYKLRQTQFDRLGKIAQFWSMGGLEESHVVIPGIPVISFEMSEKSSCSEMVIEGKGYLTNINPEKSDLIELLLDESAIFTVNELNLDSNIIWTLDFSKNPSEILESMSDGKPFIISSSDYFRFANACLLFQRIRLIFGD